MTFENLNIIAPILEALKDLGYSEPTPIQAQAIPILLQGRDLLGCAQTGTGKTCAFVVPILQLMQERTDLRAKGKRIKALIVTPTRELALQIDESVRDYGKNIAGLRHTVIFGGVKQGSQTNELHKGIDILTATPGRLLDLMQQGFIDLREVEYFVLDEADRMLDMGFIHDVRKIIAKLPAKRQSLYFSATMPPEIVELSQKILNNPAKVTVTPPATTAERVEQGVYFVDKGNKNALLIHLLKNPEISRALVFSRTKHGANKIAKVLTKSGIGAEAIHGNKSQGARVAALEGFKNGRLRVLVATDIAARGIDIDDLSHVIQYDLPNIPETYVHRIGRTGRAGASGIALAFCDAEERVYLRDIERLIRLRVDVVEKHPYTPGTPIEKDSRSEAAELEVESARGGRGGGRRQPSGKSQGQAAVNAVPKVQSGQPSKPQNQSSVNASKLPFNAQPTNQPAKLEQRGGQSSGGGQGSDSANNKRKRRRGGRGKGNPSKTTSVSSAANAVSKPQETSSGFFRGGIQWD